MSSQMDVSARHACWKMEKILYERRGPATYTSMAFHMGNWQWRMFFWTSTDHDSFYFSLKPESTQEPPVIFASVAAELICSSGTQTGCFSWKIDEKITSISRFKWEVCLPPPNRFIFSVEFMDLKTLPPFGGSIPCSIWSPPKGEPYDDTSMTALSCLGRMWLQDVQMDTKIIASDGTVDAHCAVLAAYSPILRDILVGQKLKCDEPCTVDVEDMTIEDCEAFLSCLYGTLPNDGTISHLHTLIRAAEKFQISELRKACEDCLLEGVNEKNVLERIENAHKYQMPRLKRYCIMVLIQLGKVFRVRDEFDEFLKTADMELISVIFQEAINVWKDF